jgi:hypothetical protein
MSINLSFRSPAGPGLSDDALVLALIAIAAGGRPPVGRAVRSRAPGPDWHTSLAMGGENASRRHRSRHGAPPRAGAGLAPVGHDGNGPSDRAAVAVPKAVFFGARLDYPEPTLGLPGSGCPRRLALTSRRTPTVVCERRHHVGGPSPRGRTGSHGVRNHPIFHRLACHCCSRRHRF